MAERSKHYVDSRSDKRSFLSEIYDQARRLKSGGREGIWGRDRHDGIVDLIFKGHSNVTMRSFIGAARLIGLWPNPIPGQTTWQGEQSEEQLVAVAGLNDSYAIVLRSQKVGGAEAASHYSKTPVVNAGEGFEGQERGGSFLHFPQNPTQALVDGFTVREHFGGWDDLTFVITGDIRGSRNPVANSWICSFANFPGAKIILATDPFSHELHRDIEEYLEKRQVPVTRAGLNEVLPEASVLCIAHSQITHRDSVPTMPRIDNGTFRSMPPGAIVMHDLIKGTRPEIAQGKRADGRLVYEEQIANGRFVRAALLNWLRKV